MPTFTSLKHDCEQLGKTLVKNRRDALGRVWSFCTLPNGAGTTLYYNSLSDVFVWIRKTRQIREWQQEMLPITGEL